MSSESLQSNSEAIFSLSTHIFELNEGGSRRYLSASEVDVVQGGCPVPTATFVYTFYDCLSSAYDAATDPLGPYFNVPINSPNNWGPGEYYGIYLNETSLVIAGVR